MNRSKTVMVNEMQYIQEDKNGSLIIPTKDLDDSFVESFRKEFLRAYEATFTDKEITSSSGDQTVFDHLTVLAFARIVESFSRFSAEKDHFGRDIRRYFAETRRWRYIVDVYSNLDVKLVISDFKRFILTHVPRRWSNIDYNDIIPRIIYRVDIWNSPYSKYRYTAFECPMSVEYTHKIEEARSLVGLPRQYSAKERKAYERSDRDTRRAYFNDTFGISDGRTSRQSTRTSNRNDSPS